jgi:hypothetical protein
MAHFSCFEEMLAPLPECLPLSRPRRQHQHAQETKLNGYAVTITPTGGQDGPRTTIHVDTTTGAARVTELTVKAADGTGLAPTQMPTIDLAGLVAALAPGTTPAITPSATVADVPAPARPTTRSRRGRSTPKAEKTGPKKSITRSRRRAAAAAVEEPKAGRAYRRMPDQDEVVAAWQQTRSASALAKHFEVPRHTANGWLRRLRSLGVIESRS